MATARLICVGEITSAHGVKGEVKLKSFTSVPADLARYKPLFDEKQAVEFDLRLLSQNGEMLIVSIKGVTDRNAAEKLRNTKLYFPRAKLPKPKKGVFYFADLKGLKVLDENGKEFGRVTDVMNYGGGDIIEVKTPEGREYNLPFKKPFVDDPDMDKGTLEVSIPADYPFSEKKAKKPNPKTPKKPRVPKEKKNA